ncbi:hypothetical protein EXIGLDRAFT_707367 [Exidia glandulosa HHB12029]|uniref:Uncharacterized protein n=1 Tax=Exidia glandulosa HHB12029 TaxID=1314781 RepID=A0A165JUS2_EXIGL|nr:hypothetical protein EXIGLDRAFT_707367 [Exidia glandulosa HHB12029]
MTTPPSLPHPPSPLQITPLQEVLGHLIAAALRVQEPASVRPRLAGAQIDNLLAGFRAIALSQGNLDANITDLQAAELETARFLLAALIGEYGLLQRRCNNLSSLVTSMASALGVLTDLADASGKGPLAPNVEKLIQDIALSVLVWSIVYVVSVPRLSQPIPALLLDATTYSGRQRSPQYDKSHSTNSSSVSPKRNDKDASAHKLAVNLDGALVRYLSIGCVNGSYDQVESIGSPPLRSRVKTVARTVH